MDPNFNKSPGLALPTPTDERAQHGAGAPHGPEVGPSGPEANLSPSTPITSSTAVPVSASVPATASAPANGAAQSSPATTAAMNDDDADAIDKEWISKAKAIVEKTREDPFTESRELGKVKADYLKTRYNKHIKLAEDQP